MTSTGAINEHETIETTMFIVSLSMIGVTRSFCSVLFNYLWTLFVFCLFTFCANSTYSVFPSKTYKGA